MISCGENSSSNMRLTAEGKQLLHKANELFRLIDEIKGAGATQENSICGTLNITASSVMGTHVLTPVLKVMLEKYQNVCIVLRFCTAYSIATWIQDGFVDLGLLRSRRAFPG